MVFTPSQKQDFAPIRKVDGIGPMIIRGHGPGGSGALGRFCGIATSPSHGIEFRISEGSRSPGL